jgi:hypothetical protein
VRDFARRYRIGEDKVRAMIRSGELAAINTSTALCQKPRFVITPEAMAVFEQRRSTIPPTKPQRRRRRTETIDFYPDGGA